jgi:hypothetical protein
VLAAYIISIQARVDIMQDTANRLQLLLIQEVYARFQVSTAMKIQVKVFRIVMPCNDVPKFQRTNPEDNLKKILLFIL